MRKKELPEAAAAAGVDVEDVDWAPHDPENVQTLRRQIGCIVHEHRVNTHENVFVLQFVATRIVMLHSSAEDRRLCVERAKEIVPRLVREALKPASKSDRRCHGCHSGKFDLDYAERINELVWNVIEDFTPGEALLALMQSLAGVVFYCCAHCRLRTAKDITDGFPKMLQDALDHPAMWDAAMWQATPTGEDLIH
jgi:hypothetical protein